MQVNLIPGTSAGPLGGNCRAALTPALLEVVGPPANPQARAAQEHADQRAERNRRRDADLQEVGAGNLAGPTRPSEVIRRAEREMTPDSCAARQEELRGQAEQQATQQRQDFRQALADATAREKGAAAQTPAAKMTAGPPTAEPDAARPQAASPALSGDSAADAAPDAAKPTLLPDVARPTPDAPFGPVSGARPQLSLAPAAVQTPAADTETVIRPISSVIKAPAANGSAAISAPTGTVGPQGTANGAEGPTSTPVGAAEAARLATTSRRAIPTPPAPAEAEPGGSSDANIERILRYVHARIGKDRSVATLRLDPPELGMLRLRMDLRDTQLGLLIETQTPAARRLLSDKLDELRRSLAATGIQLERCEVRVPPAAPDGPPSETPQHAQAWAGSQDGTAQQQTGSAGGGAQHGAESAPAAPAEAPLAEMMVEPAAESLVNVWA